MRVLIFILSIQILAANIASSAAMDWSFSEKPYPRREELSDVEAAKLEQIWAKMTPPYNHCIRHLQWAFEIYHDRYPKFAKVADRATRLRIWKYHVVRDNYHVERHCVESYPWRALAELTYAGDLKFCGVFSRPPTTAIERGLTSLLNEIVSYAELGRIDSMSNLYYLNGFYDFVSLNIDVEYFLRRTLSGYEVYNKYADTRHLEPHLSLQRKSFLDSAVETKDLKSVLDTTHPCDQAPDWRKQIFSEEVPKQPTSHPARRRPELGRIAPVL